MADTPKGITAILVGPEGRVCASASDFSRSYPAGFKMWEAQKHRARAAVCADYIHAACNPDLAKSILRGYPGGVDIVDRMRDDGYRIHYVAHGHGEVDPNT